MMMMSNPPSNDLFLGDHLINYLFPTNDKEYQVMTSLGFAFLESTLLGGKTLSIVGIATSGIISCITTTAGGIIKGIQYILANKNHAQDLAQYMYAIDLETQVHIIALFIMEIENVDQLPDSIVKTLEALRQILVSMHELVTQCHQQLEAHMHKWFKSWRSFDAHEWIQQLKEQNGILQIRHQMLIQLLNTHKKLN